MNKNHSLAIKGTITSTAILLVVTFIYGLSAYSRNALWQNEFTLWDDVSKRTPNISRSFTYLGIAFAREKNWEEAFKNFSRAVTIAPGDVEARHNLASYYLDRNNYELALREFMAVIRLRPELSEPYMGAGQVYSRVGRHSEALSYYQKALRRKPGAHSIRLKIAHALAKSGQMEAAKAEYLKFLEIEPASTIALSGLGNIYYTEKNYALALKRYLASVDRAPENIEQFYNIALTLDALDRPSEAAGYYKEFLDKSLGTDLEKGYTGAINKAKRRIAEIRGR